MSIIGTITNTVARVTSVVKPDKDITSPSAPRPLEPALDLNGRDEFIGKGTDCDPTSRPNLNPPPPPIDIAACRIE